MELDILELDLALDFLESLARVTAGIDAGDSVDRLIEFGSATSSLADGFHLRSQHGHTETTDQNRQEDRDDFTRVDAVSVDLEIN